MLASRADAAARQADGGFFDRIGRPIGLQVYTLGEEAGKDLDRTFAQVAAIGFRDLELPSLYGRSAREVRAAADKAGLGISSLHLAVSTRGQPAGVTLASPADEIGAAMRELGATLAVVPIMQFPEGMRPQAGEKPEAMIARTVAAAGPELWQRTAALLNEGAAKLKPAGVRLGYHNHNLEYLPLAGGRTGWDILVAETDPALVHFEIDTGWVATAGRDPVAEIARLRGRVLQLHLKDVAAGNATNYALSMKPAEVGSGTLDWARILPAAYDAGVRHFYVEQEPPFAIARIEAARKGFAFLSQLRA